MDYTFTFTGDLELTLIKTVLYGLSVSIEMNPQILSQEGNVTVPVIITNTGQLAGTIGITFELNPGSVQQLKAYYLPAGESTIDTLYLNLTEGSYQITASSQEPYGSAQTSFSVRKENQVEMAIVLGDLSDGFIPANVNLTNIGFNTIEGSVQLFVVDSAGATVWTNYQEISLPSSSTPLTSTEVFNLNPSALLAGNYLSARLRLSGFGVLLTIA